MWWSGSAVQMGMTDQGQQSKRNETWNLLGSQIYRSGKSPSSVLRPSAIVSQFAGIPFFLKEEELNWASLKTHDSPGMNNTKNFTQFQIKWRRIISWCDIIYHFF